MVRAVVQRLREPDADRRVGPGPVVAVPFQDDVRVTRTANEKNASELVMRTSFLHVVPDRHIALTDREVTLLDDAKSTVTAVGLEMDNETRVIKLLSKVRGTFEPSKAPRGNDGR